LRIETTINDVTPFRSFRTLKNDPVGEMKWRPMRRGVADMYGRAEVSQKSNDRYADALASVDSSETIGEWASKLSKKSLSSQ
jgi:hypothetical protein